MAGAETEAGGSRVQWLVQWQPRTEGEGQRTLEQVRGGSREHAGPGVCRVLRGLLRPRHEPLCSSGEDAMGRHSGVSSQEAPPGPPAQQRQALLGLTLKPRVTSSTPPRPLHSAGGRGAGALLRGCSGRASRGAPGRPQGQRSQSRQRQPAPRPSGRDTTRVLSQPRAKPSRGICLSVGGRAWPMFQKTTWPPSGSQAWGYAGTHQEGSVPHPHSAPQNPHITRFLDDTNWMA